MKVLVLDLKSRLQPMKMRVKEVDPWK